MARFRWRRRLRGLCSFVEVGSLVFPYVEKSKSRYFTNLKVDISSEKLTSRFIWCIIESWTFNFFFFKGWRKILKIESTNFKVMAFFLNDFPLLTKNWISYFETFGHFFLTFFFFLSFFYFLNGINGLFFFFEKMLS